MRIPRVFVRGLRSMAIGSACLALLALVSLHAPSVAGDDPAAKLPVPSSELVRAGAVWDAPENPLVISLAADGTISMLGRELGLDELDEELRVATRDPQTRQPNGLSKLEAVLRVSAALPWTVVQWVLQTCSFQDIGIDRVYLAVVAEADGAEGVMPAFLIHDRGAGSPRPGPAPLPRTQVSLTASNGAPSRGAIFALLKALLDANSDKTVSLTTPLPRIPRSGHVIELVDLAYRAGARWIEFSGAPSPFPRRRNAVAPPAPGPAAKAGSVAWLRAWVITNRGDEPDGVRLRVGTTVLDGAAGDSAASAPPLPPPPPRRARIPAGVPYSEKGDLEEPALWAPIRGAGALVRSRDLALGTATDEVPPDARAHAAIDLALDWLAAHQAPDGGWEAAEFAHWCNGKPAARQTTDGPGNATYDVGTTGLALLAFLGAGYTNRSEGPYGKVVGNGAKYLRNVQDAEGCFGTRETAHFVYNHALATLAIVECFGSTGSSIYKAPAQKGLDFIAAARNPNYAWRYGVKPGDNDTSITGWMTLALAVAKMIDDGDMAMGKEPPLTIDAAAFDGVRAWLGKVTDADVGRAGYVQRGTGSARKTELAQKFPANRSEAMTAFAVLLRVLLGEDPATSVPVRKGAALLAALPPVWNPDDGSIDLYYWQAGALAMQQVGGPGADAWRAALSTALVGYQRLEGEACGLKGSWDPIDPWGADGGRVYMTAMAAMCLEAPYRYPRVAPTAGRK